MPKPRNRVAVICLHCGARFETWPSTIAAGNGKYCSRACVIAARSPYPDRKICTRCGVVKVITEFDLTRTHPQGKAPPRPRPECRECRRERSRAYHAREKAALLNARLIAQFGIDKLGYDALLAAQGGRCAICGTSNPGNGFDRLHVDHDHRTGTVRGLLCSACNRGLGCFRDSPALLMVAAQYLQRSSADGPPDRSTSSDDVG